MFADVVGGVAGDFDVTDGGVFFLFVGLGRETVVAVVSRIGRNAQTRWALFVLGDDPGVAFFSGGVTPLEGALVGAAPEVLEGEAGEDVALAEEGAIDFFLLLGEGVEDDEVVVGIGGAEVGGHVADFVGGLGVFFADVPVEGEGVAEAGDHFAAVEFAFGAEGTTVEGGGDGAGFTLLAGSVVVHFVFLEFEVEVEAAGGGVVEDDAPLVELGAVVVEFVIAFDERPDVVAIAAGVVGEEGEGVDAFGGEVVEGADDAAAFAVTPLRIALAPVAEVGLPGFEGDVFFVGLGAIEVGVGEHGLGGVGTGFEEVLAAAGELQVVFADVAEPAVGAEVAAGFVGGGDGEVAGFSVEGWEWLCVIVRRWGDGGIGTAGEMDAVGPFAGFVGGEMGAPLGAGFG